MLLVQEDNSLGKKNSPLGYESMRKTFDIQDKVLTLCQQRARERGISLDEMVNEAIWFALKTQGIIPDEELVVPSFEYDLPVSGAGGVQPGVNLDRTTDLIDVMEGNI